MKSKSNVCSLSYLRDKYTKRFEKTGVASDRLRIEAIQRWVDYDEYTAAAHDILNQEMSRYYDSNGSVTIDMVAQNLSKMLHSRFVLRKGYHQDIVSSLVDIFKQEARRARVA